ncbi:MAG: hypothetical protein AAGF97_07580, partial [Planctomycetota bacterium]
MSSQRQVLLACLAAFLCFDLTLMNRMIVLVAPFEGIALGVVTAQNGLVALGLSRTRYNLWWLLGLQAASIAWIAFATFQWTIWSARADRATWCGLLIVQAILIWALQQIRRWRAAPRTSSRVTLAQLLGLTAVIAILAQTARLAWQGDFVPNEPKAIWVCLAYGTGSACCIWSAVPLTRWPQVLWVALVACL